MANDAVLFWNDVALGADATDHSMEMMMIEQPGPCFSSRALAIIHSVVFDASNSYYRYYEPYRYLVDGIEEPNSAVAGAAFTALLGLYKNQAAAFERRLEEFKMQIKFHEGSFEIGKKIAVRFLKEREDDNSELSRNRTSLAPFTNSFFPTATNSCTICDPTKPYGHRDEPDNPGCYAEMWGKVVPFAIKNLLDIDSKAPDRGNKDYYEDFDEVKELGVAPASGTKPADDQIQIGLFWAYDGVNKIGTPPRLYNQIARQVATDLEFEAHVNARFFLLINLALGDAGIHCWNAKYVHCLWRPSIGIPHDMNGHAIPEWKPLGAPRSNTNRPPATPNFPAYPSGHATFGTAAFTVMKYFADDGYQIKDFVSDELNGETTDVYFPPGDPRPRIPMSFTLDDGIKLNLESRIYLGVHWRMDGKEGRRTGRIIGEKVCDSIAREKK